VNGQNLTLCEFVEICDVNLEPSDHGLMAEICYCGKLCEFATTANPDPNDYN
jgi:hypothetical protein